MRLLPPSATRTEPLFPYTTLFRSQLENQVQQLLQRCLVEQRFDVRPLVVRGDQQRQVGVRAQRVGGVPRHRDHLAVALRSEEHTSELQSLMRISYAFFCLKKKKQPNKLNTTNITEINKEEDN